jgi:aerobic carbon-monoxide dehydrogenase large subunit
VPCVWGIAGKDGKPMKEPPRPLLARGKVRHVGDPVAMVIADSVEAPPATPPSALASNIASCRR